MIDFKELYVQSGSLVFFNCFPFAVAMGKPTKSVFEATLTPLTLFCKETSCHVYYDKVVLDALAEKALKKLLTNEKQLYQNFVKSCEHVEKLAFEAEFTPVDPQKGIENIWKAIIDFWKWSVFIDSFDAGTDFREINRIAKENNLTKEEVQILTTPAKLSYLQEFELAASEKDAGELVNKFFWINTSYVGLEKFAILHAKLEQEKRAKQREKIVNGIKRYSVSLEEKQGQFLKKRSLTENPLQLFNNLVVWRDERKRFNFTGLHGLDIYCQQIVKEAGLASELYKVVTPFECFDEEFPSESELKARFNIGAGFEAFENQVNVISGKSAAMLFDKLQAQRLDKRFDLRGQPACLGRVTGKVIVVAGPQDFNNFEQGAILVTAMTRPEFVPIMKKAAGIITDEGGITSHAAIVSRELNKPCIIGTQNASKVLKTGDFVELDAFHGLVKRLQ